MSRDFYSMSRDFLNKKILKSPYITFRYVISFGRRWVPSDQTGDTLDNIGEYLNDTKYIYTRKTYLAQMFF